VITKTGQKRLLSPIWKIIALVQYASGTVNDLKQIVQNHTFPILDENENRMVIPEASVSITRPISDTNKVKGNAPDHLMRLYAYNDLMWMMGKDFFDKQKVETKFVRKAEEAYIISPISSLVVLESKRDYDRMGIQENKNTLGNAGIGNKGFYLEKTIKTCFLKKPPKAHAFEFGFNGIDFQDF
jgi:XrtN system VIT domain protein